MSFDKILKVNLVGMCLFLVHCSDVRFEDIPQPQVAIISEVGGNRIIEKFVQQSENAKLDILFVVDNSPSMLDEQEKLGERLSSFTDQLNGIDWQIAVTNTDISNGRYGMKGHLFKFENGKNAISPNTPNFKEKFLKTVVQKKAANCDGECPSTTEEPLAAIILALNLHDRNNSHFFRDDAEFVAIVISDEDEMSTGPWEATKPRMVTSTFESIFPQKAMSAYGIIIELDDTSCKEQQGVDGSYGTHVAELAKITKGSTASVCDSDYSQGLSSIGQKAKKLVNTISLNEKPKEGSVKLSFKPAHSTQFEIEGNKITFEIAPPDGTEITVSYEKNDEIIEPISE